MIVLLSGTNNSMPDAAIFPVIKSSSIVNVVPIKQTLLISFRLISCAIASAMWSIGNSTLDNIIDLMKGVGTAYNSFCTRLFKSLSSIYNYI